MQTLTNSRRSAFARCHRMHRFQYELCRRPATTSEALRLGTLVHRGLEAWWSAQEDRIGAAIAAMQATPDTDPFVSAMAHAMVAAYHARWIGEQAEIETIAVEQEYRVPLLNPATGSSSQTWELTGKIDAIAMVQGTPMIVEHKTTSMDIDPTSDYWAKLAIDGQVSGYFVGAQSLGHEVVECLYDVVRKPAIRPLKATPPESRKYTKDGKLYAAQREEDESPEDFGCRCLAAMTEDMDRYLQRRPVARRDDDLIEYLEDMWAIGREIRDAQLANRWPRNPAGCEAFGGCSYFDVCAGRDSIDGPNFVTTEVNPELNGGN